jgi:hypothetical protein
MCKILSLVCTLSCSPEFGIFGRVLVFRVEDLLVAELNFVSGLLGVFGKVRNVVRCAVYMLWFRVECGGGAKLLEWFQVRRRKRRGRGQGFTDRQRERERGIAGCNVCRSLWEAVCV